MACFEVAAGGLGGEVVGDDVAGAALHLDPGEVGHGDPDGLAVDVEADVGGVGVAGGDGDDGSLPGDVEGFGGPAVGYGEVFVHGSLQSSARLVLGQGCWLPIGLGFLPFWGYPPGGWVLKSNVCNS